MMWSPQRPAELGEKEKKSLLAPSASSTVPAPPPPNLQPVKKTNGYDDGKGIK